ncbi:MAG: SRPBCC family protein, partial [Gammaproteobacteria bacterium]
MGQCYNSTVIDASVDKVWEMISNFHELSWGDGVVTKVDVIGDAPGTEVGARRILNGAFHETLLSIDSDSMTFTYSIDDGPGPVAKDSVTNYVGRVSLFPVT